MLSMFNKMIYFMYSYGVSGVQVSQPIAVRGRIKIPPPHSNPLATQLPYKIDEVGSTELTTTPYA